MAVEAFQTRINHQAIVGDFTLVQSGQCTTAPSLATLVMGPSGVGKTTLGLRFLAESTVEAPGLHFGFYESPHRLRLKGQSLGIDT